MTNAIYILTKFHEDSGMIEKASKLGSVARLSLFFTQVCSVPYFFICVSCALVECNMSLVVHVFLVSPARCLMVCMLLKMQGGISLLCQLMSCVASDGVHTTVPLRGHRRIVVVSSWLRCAASTHIQR